MDYVTPPRGAVGILNFFASEPDFANVVGDLSEEFQQRASAHGHLAAKRWYWREAFRNAMVLGQRELLRTPGKILAVSLLISLSTGLSVMLFNALVMGRVMVDIERAWIPYRFWPWFQAVWPILVPSMLYAGSGTVASLLVRTREFALVASFATVSTIYMVWVLYFLNYTSARGRFSASELSQIIDHEVLGWGFTIVAYSIGCFWIRLRRLARLPYRAQ